MGKQRVAIVGTGQTFHKSHRPDVNGQELINEAVQRALADAELRISDIDAIVWSACAGTWRRMNMGIDGSLNKTVAGA